jgi:hypothetical protein
MVVTLSALRVGCMVAMNTLYCLLILWIIDDDDNKVTQPTRDEGGEMESRQVPNVGALPHSYKYMNTFN